MKASDVHALNDHQLVEQIRDAREEAFNLRFRARDRRAREHLADRRLDAATSPAC